MSLQYTELRKQTNHQTTFSYLTKEISEILQTPTQHLQLRHIPDRSLPASLSAPLAAGPLKEFPAASCRKAHNAVGWRWEWALFLFPKACFHPTIRLAANGHMVHQVWSWQVAGAHWNTVVCQQLLPSERAVEEPVCTTHIATMKSPCISNPLSTLCTSRSVAKSRDILQ